MIEADTCRLLVEPKLRDAGWETPPYSVLFQPVIAPGRIVPRGKQSDGRTASSAVHTI